MQINGRLLNESVREIEKGATPPRSETLSKPPTFTFRGSREGGVIFGVSPAEELIGHHASELPTAELASALACVR